MDFGEFIRSFLGLGGRQHRDFLSPDEDDCDCEIDPSSSSSEENDHEFQFFFGNGGHSLDDMFRHFHGDMHRQMESLNQQMEDMLKGFGTIASEHFPPESRPGMVDIPESRPDDKSNRPFFFHSIQPHPKVDKRAPRDFMLKEDENVNIPKSLPAPPAPPSHEDSKFFNKPFRRVFPWNQPSQLPGQDNTQDTDLDGKISSSDAVDLIRRSNEEKLQHNSPRQGFFSGSSVTVTTVRGPDGKTEHKRVVRDSSGREESTVSRSVDGQCHTVTTIKGPDGLDERREDLKNMDENDMQKFQQKWDSHQAPQSPNPPMLGPSIRLDTRDRDLFSKLFGSPPK